MFLGCCGVTGGGVITPGASIWGDSNLCVRRGVGSGRQGQQGLELLLLEQIMDRCGAAAAGRAAAAAEAVEEELVLESTSKPPKETKSQQSTS